MYEIQETSCIGQFHRVTGLWDTLLSEYSVAGDNNNGQKGQTVAVA